MAIPQWLAGRQGIGHVESRPATPGVTADWPEWVPADVRNQVQASGVQRLWRHQVEAADAVRQGRHVAIATPTASGKTLAYLLPALASVSDAAASGNPTHLVFRRTAPTMLYLSPTKALAHDQLSRFSCMEVAGWTPVCLDGDADREERRFARDFATGVLSNPDMLHRSVLPNAQRWRRFLSNLQLVVVDECHRYRGSFGAHTAAVLRRLRRVCAAAGSEPVFVCSSATMVDAGQAASRLTGVDDFVEITEATSPRPGMDFVTWEPDAEVDVAELIGTSVRHARQTLGFVSSRKRAETVSQRVQRLVPDEKIVAYRAGYLPSERRALEQGLRAGSIAAAVATNALELGVDLGGVDTVVMDGFPDTSASMWQRAGRAGRRDRDAVVILVPAEQPLDAYVVSHPELLFDAPVESTVLHPENPYILGPHLAAAAQEIPLTPADAEVFGPGFLPAVKALTAQGVLRERPTGWYWTRPSRAVDSIDLRGVMGSPVEIIEDGTGRVVGTVDPGTADSMVHTGALYLHQGEQFLVTDYAPSDATAMVRALSEPLGYVTQALSTSEVSISSVEASRDMGAGTLFFGAVRMSSQVTGYLRRDAETLTVWDHTPLELPTHELPTQAVWWTLPGSALSKCGVDASDVGPSAHAAEHTSIAILPAFAPCDRWDIGGLSTALHPDTGELTVFVVDGYPGGAGFAAAGYRVAEQWLTATLDRLRSCTCVEGCPQCVMSPKCGNANAMLDKAGAIGLLRLLVE